MKIFLTGYPGFIGRRLVAALAGRHPDAHFVLLVQRQHVDVARAALAEAKLTRRAALVEGDLVEPDLGLDDEVLEGVTHVFHLAAIYDLSVPLELARRVNIDGTRHILDACAKMNDLQRLVYFSTCYVAGDRTGLILEDELDLGQGFKNHYESTKHAAELEVRRRRGEIPTVIIRPAIVVGDTTTGETVAIADPDPPTSHDLIREIIRLLGRRAPRYHLPMSLVHLTMRSRLLQRLLQIPESLIPYVDHPARFDTRNAQRLLGPLGITCPPVKSYLPVLCDYVKAHPDKPFLDGRAL